MWLRCAPSYRTNSLSCAIRPVPLRSRPMSIILGWTVPRFFSVRRVPVHPLFFAPAVCAERFCMRNCSLLDRQAKEPRFVNDRRCPVVGCNCKDRQTEMCAGTEGAAELPPHETDALMPSLSISWDEAESLKCATQREKVNSVIVANQNPATNRSFICRLANRREKDRE